jgi:hypothetical protein
MKTLNTRSKITVRWTTNPADMGYDGTPSNWRTSGGETMGLKRALRFKSELHQKIGSGTYGLIQYTNKGRVVTLAEISDVLTDAEYRRERAKTR